MDRSKMVKGLVGVVKEEKKKKKKMERSHGIRIVVKWIVWILMDSSCYVNDASPNWYSKINVDTVGIPWNLTKFVASLKYLELKY